MNRFILPILFNNYFIYIDSIERTTWNRKNRLNGYSEQTKCDQINFVEKFGGMGFRYKNRSSGYWKKASDLAVTDSISQHFF